jgi:uncharacterized protein YuzE
MDPIAIAGESLEVSWHYDSNADVLYLTLGGPKGAVGIDIGDGVIARYDEIAKAKALVGFTLVGVKRRLLKELVAS